MLSKNFKNYTDERGCLLPIELDLIPFLVKRVFIINDVPKNVLRGGHAHYNTKQYLLCVSGSVEVILDNGQEKIFEILKKGQGLLIENLIWDSQKFIEDNTVLIVFCSTNYDEKDYILDYNEFYKIKNNDAKKKTSTTSEY